jgi:hypothetical protein
MNLKQIAIVAALASVTTFVGVFPVEAARAVVTGNASVRSGPSTQYRKVGRLRTGDRVNVTRCTPSRRWCHVQSRRAPHGWVSSRYLDRIRGGSSRPGSICFYGARGQILPEPLDVEARRFARAEARSLWPRQVAQADLFRNFQANNPNVELPNLAVHLPYKPDGGLGCHFAISPEMPIDCSAHLAGCVAKRVVGPAKVLDHEPLKGHVLAPARSLRLLNRAEMPGTARPHKLSVSHWLRQKRTGKALQQFSSLPMLQRWC